MKRRIAVRGIIEKEGKLFCVRQRHANGKINSFWCTPGGGLDPGETLINCLKRELIEELGVEPVVGELLAVQQYSKDPEEHLEFFFRVQNSADYRDIDLSKTSHGEQEMVEFAFMDPKTVKIAPEFIKKYPNLPMINSYLNQ